jgi:hypothetical protein
MKRLHWFWRRGSVSRAERRRRNREQERSRAEGVERSSRSLRNPSGRFDSDQDFITRYGDPFE